jgi:transcription antitermination factor NusG
LPQTIPVRLREEKVARRRCRVRRGPFRGIEGVVVERINPSRLILHVDILSRGAALEIDADSLPNFSSLTTVA